MKAPYRVAAAALALCAALPAQAAHATIRPLQFFAGRTISAGALVDAFGRPAGTFTGTTVGHRDPDGATIFDQVIRMDDGSVRRRSFRLVRTGPDAIDVTGSEVVGVAHGTVVGDTLHLVSFIELSAGNPFSIVRFDQTFTRLSGRRRMSNHSDISVLGLVVRRADEVFTKTGGRR